jgi:hypothetical protein
LLCVDKKRVVPTVRPPTPENEPVSPTRSSISQASSSTSPPPRPTKQSPTRQHKKTSSKSEKKSSYKPIDFNKERPAILQTIASSQQSATNLTNALKRLNRETHNPEDDAQIQQLYKQCRQLRKDVLIYIQRTESEEWIGTLINANDELVQSLGHYERALKPVEQDSDSDAWSVSDSDEEHHHHRKQGGNSGVKRPTGRSKTEDLAERLRATSISNVPLVKPVRPGSSPPTRPPRPVEAPPARPPRPVESPPMKPPRPMALSSVVARYVVGEY